MEVTLLARTQMPVGQVLFRTCWIFEKEETDESQDHMVSTTRCRSCLSYRLGLLMRTEALHVSRIDIIYQENLEAR